MAFTVGLTEFPALTYQPYFIESLCKHRAEYESYRSWERTTSPPYDNQKDQERARQCQEALWALVVCLPWRGWRAAVPCKRRQSQDGTFEIQSSLCRAVLNVRVRGQEGSPVLRWLQVFGPWEEVPIGHHRGGSPSLSLLMTPH